MLKRCSLLRWAGALLCSLSVCHIAYLYVNVHIDVTRISDPVASSTEQNKASPRTAGLASTKAFVEDAARSFDKTYSESERNDEAYYGKGEEHNEGRDGDDDGEEEEIVTTPRPSSAKTFTKGLVHVAYAPDKKQALAVQASIASVVSAASDPSRLVVHLLVDEASSDDFRKALGVKPNCNKFNLTSGTRILVHDFNAGLVSRSIAEIPAWVSQVRGKLDSPMNYVRFYMHKLIEGFAAEDKSQVVTYLDTDTIVKGDIAEVANALLTSGKTIGFVKRPSSKTVPPGDMLGTPPKEKLWCSRRSAKWGDLLKGHTYNVGVFTVDLRRWARLKLTESVEELVKEHNQCDGKLWIGGSQPPMLLAVLEHGKKVGAEDYIEYSSSWNVDGLGWKKTLKDSKLSGARVLHWTGKGKPWRSSGLYKSWWQPHLERWYNLFPDAVRVPTSSSNDNPNQAPEGKSTCKLVLEHVSAVAVGTSKPKHCNKTRAYTCSSDGTGVHVNNGCRGLFLIGKKPTFCMPSPGKESDFCVSGTRPKPSSSCGIMFLTTFFVGIKDWQGHRSATTEFGKIKKFYYTSLSLGLNVTVLHDALPDDMINLWESSQLHFIRVDLSTHAEERLGVNDVRYFHFVDAIQNHPEWQMVFVLDGFDVLTKMNPCPFLEPGKLYVGSEPTSLERNGWLAIRFKDMGGDYLKWYKKQKDYRTLTLNCGITGGDRELILKLFKRMLAVFLDDSLKARRKNKEVNVNMAVLNYIVYREFSAELVTGDPVHSVYWKQQNRRDDIWFVHK